MKRALLMGLALVLAVNAAEQKAAATTDTAKAKPAAATAKAGESAVDTSKVFTAAELATFDGKDGHKAYIAIDGLVYDESATPAWKSGEHKGGKAGTDISQNIKKSPHGKKVLQKLPIVGKLAASSEPAAAPSAK
jgi:predicted heme/steroid binding protein